MHLKLWTEAQAECVIPELATISDYKAKYTAELASLKKQADYYALKIEDVQRKLAALDE